jgi:DNA polymerase III epsilon subunit-like protein
MRWSDVPIHFIDFEGNLTSGILEYGVVVLHRGAVAAVETRLCGPVGRIRAADTAIHGLDEYSLEAHAPFRDDFARFAELREHGPFAAHFANAENSLIKSAWPYPRTSPDFSRPGATHTDWGPWIDTGRLYTQLFPLLPTGKLEDLVTTFQLQSRLDLVAVQHCPPNRRHYHAAPYDALAGALLLLQLGERPEFRDMTIPWLLQQSTLNPEKRSALQQDELF